MKTRMWGTKRKRGSKVKMYGEYRRKNNNKKNEEKREDDNEKESKSSF
jgi:hypothetical protein